MTSFAVLLAKQADLQAEAREVDKQLALAKRGERKTVIAKIQSMLAEAGLTVDDLGPASGTSGKVGRPRTSSLAGQKLPPRYRNPSTGETWTGRGLRPRWLQTALDQGNSIDDFKL